MTPIQDALNQLKDFSQKLAIPKNSTDEKIKKQALKSLKKLESVLKYTDLKPEEWNEVYEVVLPFTNLDFTDLKPGLLDKVQTIFFKTPHDTYAPNIIQALVKSIDERRIKSIQMQAEKEKLRAKDDHQVLIEKIMKFPAEELDAALVREWVEELRKKNPRNILSTQEEVDLLQGSIKTLSSSSTNLSLFKTLKLIENGLFNFQSCIEKISGGKADEFGTVVLKPKEESFGPEAVEKLKIQRLHRLENLETVYTQTINNPHIQVCQKYFPKAQAFYVGAFQANPHFSLMELELQEIAQNYGIKVISDIRMDAQKIPTPISEKYRTDFMLDCAPMLDTLGIGRLGAFAQDYIDFSQNAEVRIPRMQVNREMGFLSTNIDDGRKMRSKEWAKIIEENEETPIPTIGVPFSQRLSLKAIALSSTLGAEPIMNLTYNEGGNTLIGQRKGSPFLIIGKDSYVISKAFMEKDLSRKVSDDEVRMAFAIDYCVANDQIYFVEQPGDFHLDMNLSIVGENKVLLNDSELAQKEFEKEQQLWLEKAIQDKPDRESFYRNFVKEEILASKLRKELEDITAQDLEKQGFEVVRVPGKFHINSRKQAMNLFNMVTFETAKGENIVILLGCIDKEYSQKFMKILSQHCDRKIDKFYFLDLKSSQESLENSGGISCRTKILS